jgi:transcriptional regulator with XRE-family HTH domain
VLMEVRPDTNFEQKLSDAMIAALPQPANGVAPQLASPVLLPRMGRDVTFARPVQSPSRQPKAARQKPKSAEIKLANRLRQLRQDKHLTLKDLATAAGMSQAYLSRVENHKVSLTIAGLEQLAEALDVPMAIFFDADSRNVPITHTPNGNGERRRFRGPTGFVFEMLAAAKKGKLMEPLIVDVQTAVQPTPLKAHSGEEFNYVLSGECTLHYGDNQLHLREGDAVYYDASIPHAAVAIKGRPCKVLAVISSRDYLFHGDLSRLLKGTGE